MIPKRREALSFKVFKIKQDIKRRLWIKQYNKLRNSEIGRLTAKPRYTGILRGRD